MFGVDFAQTVFRLDTGVSIIFSLTCASWIIREKVSLLPILMLIFLLFFGPLNQNVAWIQALSSAIYATLFVSSLFVAKEIGALSGNLQIKNFQYLDLIFYFLVLNSVFAITSKFSGLTLCQNIEYSGIESTRCIIDEYGIAGAPYIFGAFSVALVILAAERKNLLVLFIGFASLILSDSRAFAASFIPLIIYLLLKSKFGAIKYILIFVGLVAIPFIETKTVSGFRGEQLTDHSFIMRFMIYEDFINWLDALKLLVGGGANAFLEFAVQYDMPGHPDNLYIRLIAEVGVVGVMLIFAPLFDKGKSIKMQEGGKYVLYVLGLMVLGLAQESLLAVKSGHTLAFILGYLQSRNKRERPGASNKVRLIQNPTVSLSSIAFNAE